MQRFSGKPVFVTGAGSGIGAATARCFASEGAARHPRSRVIAPIFCEGLASRARYPRNSR